MKVIAIGSGHQVKRINDWNVSFATVVGVNNTWRATDKWDHLMYAGDYPKKLLAELKAQKKSHQAIHSREGETGFKKSYVGMAKMPWEQARIYLGLPIYFGVTYWILHHLKPTHIGYLGFDMNYTPSADGSTAAYGIGHDMKTRGIPDPLWQFKNVPEYIAMENPYQTLIERLKIHKGSTELVNLSDDPDTMLPWHQITLDEFQKL